MTNDTQDTTHYDPTDSSTIDMNKRRMQQGGRTFDYVQGGTIIRQLCKVFPLGWHFEYDEPIFIPSSVNAQTGEASATGTYRVDGRLIISEWAANVALGRVNSKPVTHDLTIRDIGFCAMPSPSMLETAMKGAFTDCLKRCARQLGDQFGNSLYDGGEKDEAEAAFAAPSRSAPTNQPVARPHVPAHIANDDGAPIPREEYAPVAPTAAVIQCRYCAEIITDAKVLQWCRDKRVMPNGEVDFACYHCQQKQKAAGLGIGA